MSATPKILVFWDIMLDKFTYGKVRRLNPESPAPLINVERECYKLGWSANVAANIASLDGVVHLVWALGAWENGKTDTNGAIFGKLCTEHAISLHATFVAAPTITKQRFIEVTYHQQMLRVDYEENLTLSQEQNEEIIRKIHEIQPDIIIISDYNKGMVSKYIVDALKALGTKIVVDAKPKNIELFKDVFLIKPNFKEFCWMVGREMQNEDEEVGFYAKRFANDYHTNLVITRWEKWATLCTIEWEIIHIPTEAKKVFDVTGAGDTFIAALTYGLSQWYSLVDGVILWNKASWVIVSKIGTDVITRGELNLV